MRRIAVALVVALAVAAAAYLATRGTRGRGDFGAAGPAAQQAPAAIDDGAELAGAGSTREPVADRGLDGPATAAEPEPVAPAATSASAPSSVVLAGSAVRIAIDGAEHTGDDGRAVLFARTGGRVERREIPIEGGQFSLVVPARASLFVSELELAGRALQLEANELGVPRSRSIELRGRELRGVLLHVVAAEDGAELNGVVVHASEASPFGLDQGHPGAAPAETPLRNGVASPLLIQAEGGGRWASRSYWVTAPDRAWGLVALDHANGGERTLALPLGGALDVRLIGLSGWLHPKVRVWIEGAPRRGHAFAEREPDADASARFERLPPGRYEVSVERGWADDAAVFGEATVEVVAGETVSATIELELPEPPAEVAVSGRLVLPRAWDASDVALVFAAQGDASVWADGEVVVPLDAMVRAESAGVARDAFEWNATLPSPGDYELTVRSLVVRRLLAVPPEGLANVEVVVPDAADVEVRVFDADTGAELVVPRLHWSPPRVEGILGTPLLPAERDEERGCVAFRAPAGPIAIGPADMSLVVEGDSVEFTLVPGSNELRLDASRRLGVRFHLMDGETELPWSWEWGLGAHRVDGPADRQARDVARSIGVLWFREPGAYELRAENGIPGHAPLAGFTFEVRPPALGETEIDVVVPLRPAEGG